MKKLLLIAFIGVTFLFLTISSVSAVCRYWSYEPCQGDSNGYADGHYSYSNDKNSNSYSSPTNSNSVFKGQNANIYQIRRTYGYGNPQSYYETHPVSSSGYPYFSGGPYATAAGYGGFSSYSYYGYRGYYGYW
jgi:hypothetical protein